MLYNPAFYFLGVSYIICFILAFIIKQLDLYILKTYLKQIIETDGSFFDKKTMNIKDFFGFFDPKVNAKNVGIDYTTKIKNSFVVSKNDTHIKIPNKTKIEFFIDINKPEYKRPEDIPSFYKNPEDPVALNDKDVSCTSNINNKILSNIEMTNEKNHKIPDFNVVVENSPQIKLNETSYIDHSQISNINSTNRMNKSSSINLNESSLDKRKFSSDILHERDTNFMSIICTKNYEKLSFADSVEFDKRSMKEIYLSKLIQSHILLVLFLKKSLMDPLWIRIIYFAFRVSIMFALNACFYNDSYINAMAVSNAKTVKQ